MRWLQFDHGPQLHDFQFAVRKALMLNYSISAASPHIEKKKLQSLDHGSNTFIWQRAILVTVGWFAGNTRKNKQ
jgi:hypothetical protein